MIEKNTVLILGAGASVPYGYPTMEGLRNDIISNFENYYSRWFIPRDIDHLEKQEMLSYPEKFVQRFDRANLIIDEFLAQPENRELLDVGKLAIVCSIVKYEKESKFRQKSYDPDSDWYTTLYRLLFRNLPSQEKYKVSKHALSIITFNYDRSLEYSLFDSFTNAIPINPTKIAYELNKMDINHVYGKIISLPWQNSNQYNDYRKIENDLQLKRCKNNIDVMFESRLDHPRVKKAQKVISESKRIFFLGFGFDDFNLKVLGFPEIISPTHDIYCTTYKLNARRKEEIVNLFSQKKKITSKRVFENWNCNRLIDQYLFD